MARHRRGVKWLLAAATVLAAVATAPGTAQAAPGGVPLRVATYNIHAGAGMDNVFDLDRQTDALRAMHADVIGLEEVDVHWDTRSEWRDLATELSQRLHMYVYFAPIYDLDPPSEGAPRRQYGVAILSRYRFESTENHDLTRLSTQDPDPVPAPAPGFPEAVIRVQGMPVHVYETHLDYRADPAVREMQVADTRRIMAEDCAGTAGTGAGHCPRQLLLGDFNAPHDAPELAPLWQGLQDAGPGPEAGAAGYTYPAQNPEQRIDFVTASRDHVRVHEVTVPDTLASDHRPVVADLTLERGR
ncbi:endonuclease/exonuclease/phosphatase family protein [Streptomyces odontomachi]|uniref:endonuclease/exonuclease/phosphatase family protein n=1 Tax=Streptomyces odontomachi TaxID=2944940 RepID=UPI00210A30D5|nr:endonuclease/exonuclease/phosphatase family protein [Streptomyces sp. ODS25]